MILQNQQITSQNISNAQLLGTEETVIRFGTVSQ